MQDFYKKARNHHRLNQYEEALELYQKGISCGDEKCWYGYAICLKNGYGIEKNYEESMNIIAEHFGAINDLAENGDAQAAKIISIYYSHGWVVEENAEISRYYMIKGAELGDSECQTVLGYMHYIGDGVEENYEETVKWYTLSAEQGDFEGQWRLGCMYYNGEGVEQSCDKAVNLYRLSAEQGNTEGQWRFGCMYEFGEGIEQSYDEALKWYMLSAKQGNPRGQWRLGTMYEEGKGVEQNYEEAIKWYTRSAEQGDADYQRLLGNKYHFGKFGEWNYTEAVKWYRLSAAQDNADGQWYLGRMYYQGQGVEQSYEEAAKWYTLSAEQGDATAQWRLGTMYETGKGVEQNYKEAIKLYMLSANTDALWRLGNMHEKGLGVEISMEKAIEWWTKACENESALSEEAAYRLGYVYYDGETVKRDLQKAKYYFELAFKHGYPCSYALEIIQNEQDEKSTNNLMRQYADEIVKKKTELGKLFHKVLKDLKKDFGDSWDKLQSNSQTFLTTGVVCYIALYSMGGHIYGNMDFTSAITPMFKALETELGKYLYTGYINYLIDNDIPISTFRSKRSFVKVEGPYSFSYEDPNDLEKFSLGNLHLVIGLDKKAERSGVKNDEKQQGVKGRNVIDATMLEYLKTIFEDYAFGYIDIDRAITDYIVNLAFEIKSMTDSIRNPAAHTNVMSCAKAEACANYLFKTKKILCKFVEYLKD